MLLLLYLLCVSKENVLSYVHQKPFQVIRIKCEIVLVLVLRNVSKLNLVELKLKQIQLISFFRWIECVRSLTNFDGFRVGINR